jgi:hypothetical protein
MGSTNGAKHNFSKPSWLIPILKFGLEALRIHRGTAHGKIALWLVAGGVGQ